MRDYFEFLVTFLKFNALYKPNDEWTYYHKYFYYIRRYFNFSCISFIITFGAINVYLSGLRDLMGVCITIIDITIYLNSVIRFIHTIRHMDEIEIIINKINGFKYENEKGFEIINMESTAKFVTSVSIGWIAYASIALFCMNIATFTRILQGERALVNPIYTFYDATIFPYYHLTIIFEIITQYIHAFAYISLDMFFFVTVSLINRQFDILGSNLKNCMFLAMQSENCKIEDIKNFKNAIESVDRCTYIGNTKYLNILNSDEYNKRLQKYMSNCIRHHQDLLDVIFKLEKVYSFPAFIQCGFSTVYIMFGLYSSLLEDKSDLLNAGSYLMTSITQIFFVCIFGQLLTNKAESLQTLVYEMPWYLHKNKGFRLTILVLQMNMQRTIEISAGKFFVLSHATFVGLMQSAFTYFTFLKKVTL